MTYPIHENKYLEKSLFTAKEFIRYRYENGNYPKKYIIIFQKSSERYVKRKYHAKKNVNGSQAGHMYTYKDIGFFKMNGIGAPHAVTVIEELIALGGKEFIIVGTAGGLQGFGVSVCNRAIRDEGTSYHYIPHGKYSYPDDRLTKRLSKSMECIGLQYTVGTTWTIDAPYRETKAEISRHKKDGVRSVEMEASALFALAKVRKVKIAAAFSISDLVGGDKWSPQFHKHNVKDNLHKTIDAAVYCLSK